jgi:AGZA family xanthine/uracil permease-like MFS transporter
MDGLLTSDGSENRLPRCREWAGGALPVPETAVKKRPYQWAAPGDVNAFFGLALDNLADLVLTVGLLAAVFDYPAQFALGHLVPGTAVGVVIGDLLFTWMAFRLAKRTGRTDVTAMPLGLDTPSTFGMVFFVLGPAYAESLGSGLEQEAAARHAWHIGMCAIVASGLFKLACAPFAVSIRRIVPRAGLLGSLAAIALALITFLPTLEIVGTPIVGLVSMGIVLASLTAAIPFPLRIPGALAALGVGGALYAAGTAAGWLPAGEGHSMVDPAAALWPTEWLAAAKLEWLEAWDDTLKYLPIVIPFALGTVVGGIDCTESAAAAGDEYHTGRIIAVEGLATVIAGACGGVIQTTPYIGHPAYKAMGGRAAYTLATAIIIGGAGITGSFAYLYEIIPAPAILPILVFIGLEITAQSFHATPMRHYPAVAIACVPALAAMMVIHSDKMLAAGAAPEGPLAIEVFTLHVLAAGFIVTSLIWAGMTASLIDRRLLRATLWALTAGGMTLFGIIHSPFPGGRLFVPWAIGELPAEAAGRGPLSMAAGYLLLAMTFALWRLARGKEPHIPPAEETAV